MSDFKERLLIEIKELVEKKDKLHDFIGSKSYNELSSTQKALLSVQHDAMQTYVTCLGERLGYIRE